jgi:O-methyltransferase
MFKLRYHLNNTLMLAGFVFGGGGSDYGVGLVRRLRMALRVRWNARMIEGYSNWRQHLIMVGDILRLPKEMEGDVVECGCFNGAATVNLSLACAATRRRLFVCDSFEGLSEPRAEEKVEALFGFPRHWTYEKGDLASKGGVEGVKRRVAKYGDVSCCTFVKGFFSETLDDIDAESVVLVFEDADLRSSTEDCVRSLWPKMQEGSKFYCHEPHSLHVVSLFYDNDWWEKELGLSAPGFFGSGAGIIEVLCPSKLGFALKFDTERAKSELPSLDLSPTRSGDLDAPLGG